MSILTQTDETIECFTGVDAGATGGVVTIDSKGELVSCVPFSSDVEVFSGIELKTFKHDVPKGKVFQEVYYRPRYVALEYLSSCPILNSAKSNFNLARAWEFAFESISGDFPKDHIFLVRPQEWIPRECLGKGKKSYREFLREDVREKLTLKRCRVPHEGLVDAYLIAQYLRENIEELRKRQVKKAKKKPSHLKKNSKF